MVRAPFPSWLGQVTLPSLPRTYGTDVCHPGPVILDACSCSATTGVAISPNGFDLRTRLTTSRRKRWRVPGRREREHSPATTRWDFTTVDTSHGAGAPSVRSERSLATARPLVSGA